MILIQRKHNDDPFWCIGTITNVGRREWIWTSFDISGEEYEIAEGQGCATSRADAESYVREAWRDQLKDRKPKY